MRPIEPRYLVKKGGKWRPIRMLELAILLYNAHLAERDPEIGFEDANQTLDSITRRFNKWLMIDPAVLESAMAASNFLNEKGKFVHPKGLTFDQFVGKILQETQHFDRFYNTVEWRKANDGSRTDTSSEPTPAPEDGGSDPDRGP